MSLNRSLGRRFGASCHAAAKSEGGFTLIELLIVITIIAILAGFLFPVFTGAQRQAKKVQAKNDMMQLVTAVTGYYTDYGKYPLADIKQGCDTLLGDRNGNYDNAFVVNVLRSIADSDWNASNALNSRQVVYLQGTEAKDSTNPKSGFATQAATSSNGSPIKKGAFVDPWGNEYMLFIDGDYDGWTMDYIRYSDLTYGAQRTSTCAGTWWSVSVNAFGASWGEDGKQGKNGDGKYRGSDDVLTWQ
jgi:type IV pilus assembly protein PilA